MKNIMALVDFAAQHGSKVDVFLRDTAWQMEKQQGDDVHGGEPLGECYRNAFLTALANNWDYVEGYATVTSLDIPLMHAWCLDDDGLVVDPTWPDGDAYFGVLIPLPVVTNVTARAERYGVLGNLWALRDKEAVQDIFFGIAEANGAVE